MCLFVHCFYFHCLPKRSPTTWKFRMHSQYVPLPPWFLTVNQASPYGTCFLIKHKCEHCAVIFRIICQHCYPSDYLSILTQWLPEHWGWCFWEEGTCWGRSFRRLLRDPSDKNDTIGECKRRRKESREVLPNCCEGSEWQHGQLLFK